MSQALVGDEATVTTIPAETLQVPPETPVAAAAVEIAIYTWESIRLDLRIGIQPTADGQRRVVLGVRDEDGDPLFAIIPDVAAITWPDPIQALLDQLHAELPARAEAAKLRRAAPVVTTAPPKPVKAAPAKPVAPPPTPAPVTKPAKPAKAPSAFEQQSLFG